MLRMSAEELVEIIGPCTDDVNDCEILRAAFVHRTTELDNIESQAIRRELAKAACEQCKLVYLADIQLADVPSLDDNSKKDYA